MKEAFLTYFQDNAQTMIKFGVAFLVIILTYIATRIFRRYINNTSAKHKFAPQRTASINKAGQAIIYLISLAIVSNVLGFGIQGIFVATSSFFAIVGVAFFAVWSMLSNVTASIILYFTFPYRIGDRLVIETEQKYSGILKDVTLMYLKIQTDGGSIITVPANIAIQKVITIQSEADRLATLAAAEGEKDKA